MTLSIRLYDGGEPVVLPTRFEVCPRCEGRGVHDCWEGGMTGDEMAEQGPEFFEDYMGGMYDTRCTECEGQRVVPVVNRERVDPDTLARYDEHMQLQAEMDAERDAERRAGC